MSLVEIGNENLKISQHLLPITFDFFFKGSSYRILISTENRLRFWVMLDKKVVQG